MFAISLNFKLKSNTSINFSIILHTYVLLVVCGLRNCVIKVLTMHYKKCEICGIKSGRGSGEKRLFMAQFPLNEDRCKQWVKITGKEDLVYVPIEKLHTLKYICGKHFNQKNFNRKKTRLKRYAIPSEELHGDPLSDAMLKDFPCHVSTEPSTSGVQDNKMCSPKVTSHSQIHHSPEPSTSKVADVKTQGSCHTQVGVGSEPSTSGVQDNKMCSPKVTSHSQIHHSPEPSTSKVADVKTQGSCHTQVGVGSESAETLRTPKSRKRKQPPLSDLDITPRKRKLIKKLKKSRQALKSLRQGNIMKNIKSLALKSLIRAYIRNHGKKPQGKRWTSLEKGLALAIYKKSPRTYRYLKHIIALPSARTLQTLLQTVELEPGISRTVIEHLKKKAAKLNEKDKLCALLFDEIALKKRLIYNTRLDKVEGFVDLGEEQYRSRDIADHALVFMLQGIHKKMKQPIAYYFVKGTISSQSLAILIKNIVKTVANAGYTIIATVCDQGPTNIGSLNLLKNFSDIPIDLNYFLIDDMKVFIMFDIPHLFKSIRNNFYQAGELVMDGKKGKWSHLVELEEKNKSMLHFKKITALHVNPKFRAKMKVKLAAQVLSNTVAAILKLMALTCTGDDEKSREIQETAEIIENLDKLFDCTNGPASRHDIIRKRRENVSAKSSHIEQWRNYKRTIKTLHFLKSDSNLRLKNVRCVNGYYTSLTSLEDIWKLVQTKGFKFLNLRQLNQDALENLFGMIRQHCPTNKNPTCHHFTAALKSNIITRLSTPVSRGCNCEEDNNEAMVDFDEFLHPPECQPEMTEIVQSSQTPCVEMDIPMFHIPETDARDLQLENTIFSTFEKQPTVYVAGYLASVVLKNVNWQCKGCETSLKVNDPEQNSVYNYIRLREWWQVKRSLTYPTINLCHLVDGATRTFEDIKCNLHEKNITKHAVTMILTNCDSLSWICGEHRNRLLDILLIRLSILLIRNECRRINQTFVAAEETSADSNKKAQMQGIAK